MRSSIFVKNHRKMKTVYRASLLMLLMPGVAFAQTLVSTTPQNKKVLLEEFTRIHCGNCPAGNVIANDIMDIYPEQVFVIGLHSGFLAVPNPGEPDFRHPDAEAISDEFNLNATPRALVNRSEYNGNVLLSTSSWAAATSQVLGQSAPVNIGMATDFNAATRELSVTVELYYTTDAPASSNYLTVALTESGIIGWQTDYQNGNQPNYEHNHVFRGHLTDLWGEEITDTDMGSFVSRTYTMTVPNDFVIENCHVLAHVGEYRSEIYNAIEVAADGDTTVGVEQLSKEFLGRAFPVPASTHVQVPILADAGQGDLVLYNANGAQVLQVPVGYRQNLLRLDESHLASGLYSYRFEGENGISKARVLAIMP